MKSVRSCSRKCRFVFFSLPRNLCDLRMPKITCKSVARCHYCDNFVDLTDFFKKFWISSHNRVHFLGQKLFSPGGTLSRKFTTLKIRSIQKSVDISNFQGCEFPTKCAARGKKFLPQKVDTIMTRNPKFLEKIGQIDKVIAIMTSGY